MKMPHVVVKTTTTTRRQIALTGSQVEDILAKWAEKEYNLKDVEVNIDCGNDHLREAVIAETSIDTNTSNIIS